MNRFFNIHSISIFEINSDLIFTAIFQYRVKPVLRGHLSDKEKLVF